MYVGRLLEPPPLTLPPRAAAVGAGAGAGATGAGTVAVAAAPSAAAAASLFLFEPGTASAIIAFGGSDAPEEADCCFSALVRHRSPGRGRRGFSGWLARPPPSLERRGGGKVLLGELRSIELLLPVWPFWEGFACLGDDAASLVAAGAAAVDDAGAAAVAHADLFQGIRCLGEGPSLGLGAVTALLGVGRCCCCCCCCRCVGLTPAASVVVGLCSSRLPRSSSALRVRHGICGCMAGCYSPFTATLPCSSTAPLSCGLLFPAGHFLAPSRLILHLGSLNTPYSVTPPNPTVK